MKIVVIGASGTIGRAVTAELEQSGAHEVIRVGRTRGDHQVDITNADSVAALFASSVAWTPSSPRPATCSSAHSRE